MTMLFNVAHVAMTQTRHDQHMEDLSKPRTYVVLGFVASECSDTCELSANRAVLRPVFKVFASSLKYAEN